MFEIQLSANEKKYLSKATKQLAKDIIQGSLHEALTSFLLAYKRFQLKEQGVTLPEPKNATQDSTQPDRNNHV